MIQIMESQPITKKSFFEPVQNWYARYEQPISSISLVGGFIFDAITLKRVDMFWENVWVVLHLVGVALFIFLIHALERREHAVKDPSQLHFWLVNGMQFLFGGLLSTYVVFYFRSTSLFVTWPFLLILAFAFFANERLKSHFDRLLFQLSLLYLSLISFSIFLFPVLLKKIGPGIFFLSTAVSLVVIVSFIALLFRFSREKLHSHLFSLTLSIGGMFVLINLLYLANLIPPIPLSLKDSGVYHSITRDESGSYIALGEKQSFFDYFRIYEPVHIHSGDSIFVYSAIFSPSNLNITILHEWQRYDEQKNDWVTVSTVSLPLVGGRENGFRTFSQKQFLVPGKWRVDVKTIHNQVIGRIYLRIVQSDADPVTESVLK